MKEFGFRELPHGGQAGGRDVGGAVAPGTKPLQAALPPLQPVPLAADGEADPRLALTIGVSGAPQSGAASQYHPHARVDLSKQKHVSSVQVLESFNA